MKIDILVNGNDNKCFTCITTEDGMYIGKPLLYIQINDKINVELDIETLKTITKRLEQAMIKYKELNT